MCTYYKLLMFIRIYQGLLNGNPKNQQIYILWNCMSDVKVNNQDVFAKNREEFEKLISSNSFMHKMKV